MSVATSAPRSKLGPPCVDCKTRRGLTNPVSGRPIRRDGSAYGFTGDLCLLCLQRHYKRVARAEEKNRLERREAAKQTAAFAVTAKVERYIRIAAKAPSACDLCGQDPRGRRFSGAEFSLEGLICGGCRDELIDERAAIRANKLVRTSYLHVGDGSGTAHAEGRRPNLPILNPDFTREELTAKAAAALILAETRHVFRGRKSA